MRLVLGQTQLPDAASTALQAITALCRALAVRWHWDEATDTLYIASPVTGKRVALEIPGPAAPAGDPSAAISARLQALLEQAGGLPVAAGTEADLTIALEAGPEFPRGVSVLYRWPGGGHGRRLAGLLAREVAAAAGVPELGIRARLKGVPQTSSPTIRLSIGVPGEWAVNPVAVAEAVFQALVRHWLDLAQADGAAGPPYIAPRDDAWGEQPSPPGITLPPEGFKVPDGPVEVVILPTILEPLGSPPDEEQGARVVLYPDTDLAPRESGSEEPWAPPPEEHWASAPVENWASLPVENWASPPVENWGTAPEEPVAPVANGPAASAVEGTWADAPAATPAEGQPTPTLYQIHEPEAQDATEPMPVPASSALLRFDPRRPPGAGNIQVFQREISGDPVPPEVQPLPLEALFAAPPPIPAALVSAHAQGPALAQASLKAVRPPIRRTSTRIIDTGGPVIRIPDRKR